MQQLAMHLNVKLVARPVQSAPAKTKTKRRKAISEINCLSFAFEIFIYKREINSTPCHRQLPHRQEYCAAKHNLRTCQLNGLVAKLDCLINLLAVYQYL